ncbi:MAG: M20 family metallopeptidase [Fusobacterium perfoetens]|uniref:M20 metallopeptidase family protein n=1 Tax=Fusobacterium perfoetens TaxID=852 RepID=UPI0023F318BE|nr:M20 family metallopeptidase [Fusobacterium perfoetens]MCI6152882.1 M20 family metallopeptidase [Fusobacterium perfoetens]MDY3237294.1 M20 family metallopeptidase [Fusobacterium perfoetens]
MFQNNFIKNEVEKIKEELIEIRRRIHENPELSMEEYETSDFIVKKLKEFGLENIEKIGKTGVVALIEGKGERCIGIRADIDALPLSENTKLPFASKKEKVCHACGHDIHITCLLGVAKILNENKDKILGKVKLIFQPAEETGVGAKYMIENKALENPVPEVIFGLHCWPNVEAGKVYHRHGEMSAASDTFKIIIEGKQGHAAHPYKAVDPIMIAGNIIVGIQNIISREVSPLESGVITISTIHGGEVINVIPKTVEIQGSIRTLSNEIREYVHKRLEEVACGIAETYRGKAIVQINKKTPNVVNEEKISNLIEKACKDILGEENYIYNPVPSMGSEDFAYYLQKIPGAMFRLGCGYKDKENYPLHSDMFNANEECITTGVISLLAIVNKLYEE